MKHLQGVMQQLLIKKILWFPFLWMALSLLSTTPITESAQLLPVSYTFEDGIFEYSEPTTTCPWNRGERICYYNREIKPKLVDCDLGTESGILNPSLLDGVYTIRGTEINRVDITFSFESPVLLSSVTFYYFCSDTRYTVAAYIFRTGTGIPLDPVALSCESANTLSQAMYTLDTGEYQEIRLSVRYHGTQPVDLYLSEVMFLDSETDVTPTTCSTIKTSTTGACSGCSITTTPTIATIPVPTSSVQPQPNKITPTYDTVHLATVPQDGSGCSITITPTIATVPVPTSSVQPQPNKITPTYDTVHLATVPQDVHTTTTQHTPNTMTTPTTVFITTDTTCTTTELTCTCTPILQTPEVAGKNQDDNFSDILLPWILFAVSTTLFIAVTIAFLVYLTINRCKAAPATSEIRALNKMALAMDENPAYTCPADAHIYDVI